MAFRVSQSNHGFVRGTPLVRQGGLWQSTTGAWTAVVSAVIDADTFEAADSGVIEYPIGSLTPDQAVTTSAGTAVGTAIAHNKLLLTPTTSGSTGTSTPSTVVVSSGPTGTGSPNALTKWSSAETLSSSQITDTGTSITIPGPVNFPGTPTAPTASPGTNTTQLATTAFVETAIAPLAPLASPALTGTPTAPTASPGTNTAQLATTAFVQTAIKAKTILDYGVIGNGTDETAAIQSAINTMVSAGLSVVFPPTTNGYSFWNVSVPDNALVFGSLTVVKAPSGSDSGANRVSSMFKVNGDNVTITGFVFKGANITDKPAFIQNLGRNAFSCVGNYFTTNGYEAVIDRAGNGTLIKNCDLRLGVGGDKGVGISFIGNSRNGEVADTDIRGYHVTKLPQGIGVQPSGDLWGSVGINCQIGTQFDTLQWKHISGTYTIVDLIPPPITISDAQIVDPTNWEGAVITGMDTTYGTGSPGQTSTVSFSVGSLTLNNLPGYSIGAVATYRAYSYEDSPRYITFRNVSITGMIYAGISVITGRDIDAVGCTFRNIGDIAWDCEGSLRCSCTGGQFNECGTGATPGGYGARIDDNKFKNCGRVIGAWNADIAYQGDTAIVPFGLRGMNSFSGNTFFDDTLAANDRTTIECWTPHTVISGNVSQGRVLRSFILNNADSVTLKDNTAFARMDITGCKKLSARGNSFDHVYQGAMELTNCTQFSVRDTTIMNTAGAFGNANGVKYTGCTNGEIVNTVGISMLYTTTPGDLTVVDGGGNTSVAVSGTVTL